MIRGEGALPKTTQLRTVKCYKYVNKYFNGVYYEITDTKCTILRSLVTKLRSVAQSVLDLQTAMQAQKGACAQKKKERESAVGRETDRQQDVPANMPLGRRTPRGTKRWYVVHAPGREQATCDKLRKIVSPDLLEDAFVPRKERWRKYHGEWQCYTVPLFRDYLVVATKDAPALDKQLAKLSFPAQIAKGDGRHYAPMDADAQAFYEQMMDATHTIRSSTGVIVDGELRLQEGPLVGREGSVVKVMRPKRNCLVAVGDADTPGEGAFCENVPLIIPFRS